MTDELEAAFNEVERVARERDAARERVEQLERRVATAEEAVRRLKDRIDARLDNQLCEMQEGYDDSITGFNEAWDVVRKAFDEALTAAVEK